MSPRIKQPSGSLLTVRYDAEGGPDFAELLSAKYRGVDGSGPARVFLIAVSLKITGAALTLRAGSDRPAPVPYTGHGTQTSACRCCLLRRSPNRSDVRSRGDDTRYPSDNGYRLRYVGCRGSLGCWPQTTSGQLRLQIVPPQSLGKAAMRASKNASNARATRSPSPSSLGDIATGHAKDNAEDARNHAAAELGGKPEGDRRRKARLAAGNSAPARHRSLRSWTGRLPAGLREYQLRSGRGRAHLAR